LTLARRGDGEPQAALRSADNDRMPVDSSSPLRLLLLGPTPKRQLRSSQSMLALAVYVAFAGLQHVEVLLGLIDPAESAALSGFYLATAALFFVVIRSGLSERWTADPALTVPQMVLGFVAAAGSYAITGPARGAVMTLLLLVLVFGMFALRPNQARGLALLAFGLLSAAMLWKSRTDPARYPPAVEAIHFVFLGIVTAGIATLSVRMSRLRARLSEQKHALAQALEQIRLLATRDELTGLVNRRHMGALMATEQARQRRTGQALSLVLIDIDLFKRVNDEHGHAAGDAVLKAFAGAAQAGLRASDVLSRWGGEEFLLMLPDTGQAPAQQCVERVRALLAQVSFDAVAPGLVVTFSAGLAVCGQDEALDAAIERADQAMYRAKTAGRNCTVVA
jgi:diguanylate cyclase